MLTTRLDRASPNEKTDLCVKTATERVWECDTARHANV